MVALIPVPASQTRRPSHTILLVEDDPRDQDLVKTACNAAIQGCELIVAVSGAEAWKRLTEDDSPTLVLLDIRLPDMGGLELLQRIKSHERLSSLPVLVLSGVDDPKVVKASLALGASEYLNKPNSFDRMVELAEAIKACWLNAADTAQQ